VKTGLRGALGIILSAAFLYLAFRNVPFDSVVENIRRANPWLLILSTIAATLIFPLRARRWRPILDPIAPNLPFTTLWRPTAIGMMLNNVTPARAGELARAFLLSRSTPRVSFPAAFASLAVDRLFDAVVVFVLMFSAMLDPAFPSGARILGRSMSSLAMGGLLFIGVVMVAMYVMVLFPSHVLTLYEMIIRRVAPRFEAKGKVALEALVHGLSVLRTPSRFASVLAWTVAHWLLNALSLWIAFKAVHVEAPFTAALFLQGLIAMGVAAPQAPGFFGVFEFLGKEGLSLYGVAPDDAATWAISFHFLSYVPITIIGAWYFLRTGLSIGELNKAERASEQE
jgi:glycosyltransferase 2 family protein